MAEELKEVRTREMCTVLIMGAAVRQWSYLGGRRRVVASLPPA